MGRPSILTLLFIVVNSVGALQEFVGCVAGESDDDETSLLQGKAFQNKPTKSQYKSVSRGLTLNSNMQVVEQEQATASSELKSVAGEYSKSTARTTEFLAVVPNDAVHTRSNYTLGWLKLEYPAGGASATSEVSLTELTSAPPELGNWYNLFIGRGGYEPAKIFGDNLYLLANSGTVPSTNMTLPEGGCCADKLWVYPKTGTNKVAIDLQPIVQGVLPDFGFPPSRVESWDGFAHTSHTFSVSQIDGVPHAFCLIQYSESKLDGIIMDAMFALNLVNWTVTPTADGDAVWKFFDKVGTLEESEDATRFKLQYVKGGFSEQWHGNGIERFTSKAGVTMIAWTCRTQAEAILLKDPWTYTSANAGGMILQRFGNPVQFVNGKMSKRRSFGIDPSEGPRFDWETLDGGAHNMFYAIKADGTETLSMFANHAGPDSPTSHLFEFELTVTDEQHKAVSDDVFRTAYSTAPFTFFTTSQGGVRPLGDGVWIGAGGKSGVGYQVVDREGNTLTYDSPYENAAFYDPFTVIKIMG